MCFVSCHNYAIVILVPFVSFSFKATKFHVFKAMCDQGGNSTVLSIKTESETAKSFDVLRKIAKKFMLNVVDFLQ